MFSLSNTGFPLKDVFDGELKKSKVSARRFPDVLIGADAYASLERLHLSGIRRKQW